MEPATLRRHTQRGTYDFQSAKAVFDECFIAHVSYVDHGLPQCLPMIALIKKEEDEDDEDAETSLSDEDPADEVDEKNLNNVVYLHGHPSTRIVELVREASRETHNAAHNAQETQSRALDPVKVCITATKGSVFSSPIVNFC